MTDDPSYRLYLEECFKGIRSEIRAGFDNIHIELTAIKEQTTKTNNRVTHLEDEKVEYLKTRVSTDMLKAVNEKVESMREDLLEYKFFKKYPRIFIGVILVMALSMVVGFGIIRTGQSNLKKEVDMINSPVTTRGGTIEWWPSGVLIDSLNKK